MSNAILENTCGRPLSDAEKAAWEKIQIARPQISGFIQRAAHRTLFEYGKDILAEPSRISDVLTEVLRSKIATLLGEAAASEVDNTLSTIANIDTSSHGGILSEDTLVQSQLVLGAGVAQLGPSAMMSLACGVVPMNNATWPRGFFRHGRRESLFPKSFDRIAVHECQAFSKEMIEKKLLDNSLDSCTKKIYEQIDSVPNVYAVQKFHEQFTIINHMLWRQFGEVSGISHFFQPLLEDITRELVARSIEANDVLAKLIFCEVNHEAFIETFANLPGTWTLDRKKGTFLFWHASGDFRAASVWPEGSNLILSNGEIPFTPESIVSQLRAGSLVPSVFLSLVTLLYYGARPSGGYHQIAYLPEYAKRLKTFSHATKVAECPTFLGSIDHADLFQLGYGFTYIADPKSETKFAGVDSLICDPVGIDEFKKNISTTTVGASLINNTERWYKEVVPVAQR